MTMIKRVAQALEPMWWTVPVDDYPAEKARREARQAESLMKARAAIEAMREPTEAMREAGRDAFERDDYHMSVYHCIGVGYTAMVQAALEEK